MIDPTGEVLLEDYTTEGVSVAEVTVATQTSADRAAPAALGELVRKAFDVTKGRWDLQGRAKLRRGTSFYITLVISGSGQTPIWQRPTSASATAW